MQREVRLLEEILEVDVKVDNLSLKAHVKSLNMKAIRSLDSYIAAFRPKSFKIKRSGSGLTVLIERS